jgi:hypothetical protein
MAEQRLWQDMTLDAIAMLKVVANLYHDGDVDAAWAAVLRSLEDHPIKMVNVQTDQARMHLSTARHR